MNQIFLVAQDRRPAGIVMLDEQAATVHLAPEFAAQQNALETLLAKAFTEGVESRMPESRGDQLRTVKTIVRAGNPSFARAIRDNINAARLGSPRLFAFVKNEGTVGRGGGK